MAKSTINTRSDSNNKGTQIENQPFIKPHQITMYLMRGEYLKAALLRNWEITLSNRKQLKCQGEK